MRFDVVGPITNVAIIATGSGIRALRYLRKHYGAGRWRKLKGVATVQLPNGALRKVELHWYAAHGIGKRDVQDQTLSGRMMKQQKKRFALCIENADHEASLILGKVYRVIPDARAAKDDLVRIVDESGEDYLHHTSQFVFVDFPQSVAKKVLALEAAN